MFSQTTRLELVIVAAALLVLFLCRQPPKSGNAGIHMDVGQTPETGQRTNDEMQSGGDIAAFNQEPSNSQLQAIQLPPDAGTPDNTFTQLAVPPRPKMKRIAVVDARKCDGLKYKDLMYGEVTVQWVWEGGKGVFKKVCQVREPSGTVSTWSFDNNDGIVISELPQETEQK
jgi:hypothetical protein